MNKQTIIKLLNEDLTREYAHWNFYLQAGTRVIGLHRAELSEFFLKEAANEMKHIEEFKRLIIGLGASPTCEVARFSVELTQPIDLLREAIRMEDEVTENYVLRIRDTEEMQADDPGTGTAPPVKDMVDGKYIELFLEEQILHSRADADHMREMVKGLA